MRRAELPFPAVLLGGEGAQAGKRVRYVREEKIPRKLERSAISLRFWAKGTDI